MMKISHSAALSRPLRFHIFSAAVLFIILQPAHAALVKNISTGINDIDGTKIANNTPDNDFIIGPGSTAQVGTIPIARSTPLAPSYIGDGASTASRWLGIDTGVGEEGLNVPKGFYNWETQVSLAGFDPSTAQVTDMRYSADDKLERVFINAQVAWVRPILFGGDFFEFHNVGDIGLGLFQSGINTLMFEVRNDPDPPTAMTLRIEGRVEAEIAAAVLVPEPASLTLLGLGLLIVCCGRGCRSR